MLEPFLLGWVRHLEYERTGYVLEGYHISVEAASALAELGFRVAALGIQSVVAKEKCREIRTFAENGDWTERLSESELFDLVVRYQAESAKLRVDCEERGLTYFEMGGAGAANLETVLNHLSVGA